MYLCVLAMAWAITLVRLVRFSQLPLSRLSVVWICCLLGPIREMTMGFTNDLSVLIVLVTLLTTVSWLIGGMLVNRLVTFRRVPVSVGSTVLVIRVCSVVTLLGPV